MNKRILAGVARNRYRCGAGHTVLRLGVQPSPLST